MQGDVAVTVAIALFFVKSEGIEHINYRSDAGNWFLGKIKAIGEGTTQSAVQINGRAGHAADDVVFAHPLTR